MTSQLTPLASLQVLIHHIPAYNLVPNTSLQQKPLLIYKSAFPPQTIDASKIESHLKAVGVVDPHWRYTMYSFDHFHSSAHEVLSIAAGKARLCFGHAENPERVEAVVERGDVLVLPAGVSHRLLEDLEGGFEMVGSYPKGWSWDMCYGKKGEEKQIEAIKKLPWFTKDPIYGSEGPVLDV